MSAPDDEAGQEAVHSAGPWGACRCGCGLIWDASGEIHVASAISGREIGQPWHCGDVAIGDAEHAANTRLLAAAPNLLAALRGMVALFGPDDMLVPTGTRRAALTAARSALSTADALVGGAATTGGAK